MAGTHRGTTQAPLQSVLKSVAWLLVLAGILLVPLAVLGAFSYLAVADPTAASVVLTGLQGALCAKFAVGIARILARRLPRSPADVDELISSGFWLTAFATTLLASIGHLQGWVSGTPGYVLGAIGGLLLAGAAAYSLGGKRRLMAALDARSARKNGPS
jgi:hypothetical protein